MATTLSTIVADARIQLIETSAFFWTDAELLAHAVRGVKDLWKAILDLHQEHFLTIDQTNVSLPANSSALSGVPTDVFRVYALEPRDLTDNNPRQNIIFEAKDWHHPDFVAARGVSAQDASNLTIYFCVIGAGSPVAAPTIRTAPLITADLPVTLAYIPAIPVLTSGSDNPIPGESDNALVAWTI